MVITLTVLNLDSSTTSIAIDDSSIISVLANGVANSTVNYNDYGNVPQQIVVTSTPAAIASASGAIFSVTAYDNYQLGQTGTTTQYINATLVSPNIIDTGSVRVLQYNAKGFTFKSIYVSDSLATLVSAINVASSPSVTIAGTQTITGAKTFSADTVFSSTTDSTSGTTGAINTLGGIGVTKDVWGGAGLTYTTLLKEGLTTGITAFAGGGQASATALTTSVNNVTVCATNLDSVKLPAAATGLTVTVKNSGTALLAVFPATSDSIDALAINLAIRVYPGSVVTFRAISAVVWESSADAALTLNSPTTNTGQLVLLAADSAGNTTTTITNASQAAARLYSIPDAGTNTSFVMGAGAASIAGVKTFSDSTQSTDSTTGGTLFAGGLGVAKNLFIGGVYGGKANVLASSGNTTMTEVMSGATMLLDAAAVAYVLPAITASNVGMHFDFVTTVAASAQSITAGAADLMTGGIVLSDDTAAYTAPQSVVLKPAGTFLVYAANGTTTGGKVGTKLRFTAISATAWFVEGYSFGSGVLATPFS